MTGRKWAADLGCSTTRVSNLRKAWERFGDRRREIRFWDALHASLVPARAEERVTEAQELGLSVSGLRQRELRGETKVPSTRKLDPILKNAVASRSAILRALDAVNAGRLPEDPEAVRSVAEEIQQAARGLAAALRPLKAVR